MKKLLLFSMLMGVSITMLFAGFTPTSGPAGGGTARAFLKDGSSVYACVGLGLYKTSDNGSTWTKLDVAADVSDFYGIAKSGNYLVTTCNNGKNRIYRSSDNGATWTASSTGMPQVSGFDIYVPTQLMTMKDTLFIATTTAGVYKSSDQGATWVATGQATSCINAICYSGDTLFIGGASIKPAWSTDMGKTFNTISGDLINLSGNKFNACNRMAFHQGRWFAASAYTWGVVYSDDMGATWNKPNISPNWCDFVCVAGKKVWFGGSSKYLYSSDDMGATFNADKLDNQNLEIQAIYDDGSMVWVGTLYNGIYAASDARGKATWMAKNNGLNHQNVKKMIASGNTLFALCNGKIFQTSDQGSTWSNKDTGTYNYIQFVGSDLMGCKQNGLYKSTDMGVTWTEISGMTGKNVSAIGGNTSLMIAATKATTPEIYTSTDGGNSWSLKTVTGTNFFWGSYSATDIQSFGTNKYIIPTTSGYVVTTDGNTFAFSNPLNSGGVYAIQGNRILVNILGQIQVSENEGKTWRKFSNGIPGFFLQVGGLCTFNNNAYIYNLDAGGTIGIYQLTSTDTIWKSMANTDGIKVAPTIAMIGLGQKMYAAPTGQSVWSVNLQGGGGPSGITLPQHHQISWYPNPVKPGEFLQTVAQIPMNEMVSIYSIQGQLISRFGYQGGIQISENIKPGMYILQIGQAPVSKFIVE